MRLARAIGLLGCMASVPACFAAAPTVAADSEATESTGNDTTAGDDQATGTTSGSGISGDVEPDSGSGSDDACDPLLIPALVPELSADIVMAIDPEFMGPAAEGPLSTALMTVENDWATAAVNFALISPGIYFQPLHDPTCDTCMGCKPVSVHAFYEVPPAGPLGVVEPLLDFFGMVQCILRPPDVATRHHVLVTSRGPASDVQAYADFAQIQESPELRPRFHLVHTESCDPGSGLAFEEPTVASGGLTADFCEDPLDVFLRNVGRRRLSCTWPAPEGLEPDAFVVHATSVATGDVTEWANVPPDVCDDGAEAAFFVEGMTVTLCPTTCDWAQSVPIADFVFDYAVPCG